MSEREKKLQDVLLLVHERGGLGNEMHERILTALGTPNGKFCRDARSCLAVGRCMNQAKYDRSCND